MKTNQEATEATKELKTSHEATNEVKRSEREEVNATIAAVEVQKK